MKIDDYFEKKKQETDKSFSFLIERCTHCEETPHGIKLCEEIDVHRPMIVLLPGTANGSEMLRATNGLLKKLDNFIFNNGLAVDKKEVQVCAAVCYFGKYFKPDMARQLLYLFHIDYSSYAAQMCKFAQLENDEYAFPNYVADLYARLLLPRLQDSCSRLLPFSEARRRLQKLIFVTYCHGAYTWLKIEEQINFLLSGSSYTNRQKKRLLKSITVLAYSPDCPLGYSKAQLISLASAADLTIQHGSNFVRYVHRGIFVEDFGLCYLPPQYGNVFYCAQVSKQGVEGNPRVLLRISPEDWYENLHQPKEKCEKPHLSEHGFLGFEAIEGMSQAALKLQQIGRQILQNALNNALRSSPKELSVSSLLGKNNFFVFLKANIKGRIILHKSFYWRKNSDASFVDGIGMVRLD